MKITTIFISKREISSQRTAIIVSLGIIQSDIKMLFRHSNNSQTTTQIACGDMSACKRTKIRKWAKSPMDAKKSIFKKAYFTN